MGIWIVSPFFGYYEYWCCGQFSIQAFAGIYFQFSGYVSRNRTAGSYTVSLCLTFWGTARLFPQVAVHVTFPPALLWFGWTLPTAVNGFSSVAQSCPTLCDLMNRSMPGLPVHHQLPEFTQTHVHRVGDAIKPSHPLSSPSPPAPNPSQQQGLFQSVNS